jgi:hypothetical protein
LLQRTIAGSMNLRPYMLYQLQGLGDQKAQAQKWIVSLFLQSPAAIT